MIENKRILKIEKGAKYNTKEDDDFIPLNNAYYKMRFVDVDGREEINPDPYLGAYTVLDSKKLFYVVESEGNKLDAGKLNCGKIKVKVKPDSNGDYQIVLCENDKCITLPKASLSFYKNYDSGKHHDPLIQNDLANCNTDYDLSKYAADDSLILEIHKSPYQMVSGANYIASIAEKGGKRICLLDSFTPVFDINDNDPYLFVLMNQGENISCTKAILHGFNYITIVKNQNGDYHSYFSDKYGTPKNLTDYFTDELGIEYNHCKPLNALLNNILKSAKHEENTCQEKLKIQEEECKNIIEQLQQNNEDQENECKAIIDQLEKQNDQLKEENANQEKKCNSTIDQLEKQNDQLKEENANQEKKCSSTIDQLKKLNSQQKKECEKRIDKLEQKNEDQENECSSTIDQLERQNDRLKKENTNQEEKCNNTISQLERQNDQLNKENTNQEEKCDSTIDQLKKLNSQQKKEYKKTIDKLEQKNEDQKNECSSTIDQLERQNDRLKKENTNQEEKCNNTISQLERQNDQLKKENTNQEEKCDSTIDQLRKLNSQQKRECKKDIDKLEQKNEDQENECKATIDQLTARIRDLESTLRPLADDKSYHQMSEQQYFKYIDNGAETLLNQDLHYY